MRTSTKQKVLYCLEKFPATRNSDIQLTATIWLQYHRQYVFQNDRGEWCIKIKSLENLPTQDEIKRWRAKIQNHKTKPQFIPTDREIALQRSWNEEEWRKKLGYNPEMKEAY